jgi:hypothetical protein
MSLNEQDAKTHRFNAGGFGFPFICSYLYSQSAIAEPAKAIYPESLDKIKNFHNQFISPAYSSSGQVRSKLPEMAETSRLADEKIFMNSSSQSLEGLISVNGGKHRSVAYDDLLESTNCKMNSMDISVTGITVIAINMAEGGNAVATSDIVLHPVQSLGGAAALNAEVDEKLK